MSRPIETLLATVAGFSAGVVFGLLLSPKSGKENRKWVENHSTRFVKEGEERLGKIASNVKEIIPDLYEATESIIFDDDDLEEDA